MARAAGAEERVAFRVESTADVSGFRAARAENSALAKDAKASAADIVAGQDKIRISREKMIELERRAMTEANAAATAEEARAKNRFTALSGDQTRLNQLIKEYIAEQRALAAATLQATAAQQQQNMARGAVGGGGAAGVGLPSAAAASVTRVSAEVDRIPAKARTAANALSMMAFAAGDGSGGMRSLAVAAGSAADGIASMSGNARIAASAAGIGALITVATAAIVILDNMEKKAREAGKQVASSLGDMSDKALAARGVIAEDAFRRAQERLAKTEETPFMSRDLIEVQRAKNALAKAGAEREEVFKAQRQRDRDRGRQESDERRQKAEDDNRTAIEMMRDLELEVEKSHLRRIGRKDDIALLELEATFTQQQREIAALDVAEQKKTDLLQRAYDVRMRLQEEHLNEMSRQRSEAADKELRKAEEEGERRLTVVANTMQAALHTANTTEESFGKTFGRMLGSAIVKELEILAVRHTINALADAAFGLFASAAKHAAVAAAAVAGARTVARISGVSGGGGGSSIANGPSLSTGDPSKAPTNVTVVVQTVNPFSKEVMGETQYQLNRSGVLKQPIYAPPTSGAYAL